MQKLVVVLRREGPDGEVAVIDSGVDYTHPDLSANIWVSIVLSWTRFLDVGNFSVTSI